MAFVLPAGRMQDRMGPRLVATIGGILVGLGMCLASFFTSPLGYAIGFGVLAGAGIGGFMLAMLAGKVYVATQSFNFAYYCSAALLVLAALVSFAVKPPHHADQKARAPRLEQGDTLCAQPRSRPSS